MSALILAGDVGGTKTLLGLFRLHDSGLELIRGRTYATKDFEGLADVCADFIAGHSEQIQHACFGVPGVVIDGQSCASNVAWELDEGNLSRALGGIRVRLINDLCATAYGAIHLPDSEVEVLQSGAIGLHHGHLAIIAPGTGLGESALIFDRGNYEAVASEGGHASFAPRDDEQIELYRYLRARFGHVSVERVLSGPGLFNIYNFVRAVRGNREPDWLRARFEKEDAGAVISEVAIDGRDSECVHALQMFVDIFGAEAGNLALKILAFGGVYLCGGIAPKILPALKDGRFIRAFLDKGRLSDVLKRIEVRVSLNESVGLAGAAHAAAALIFRTV
jgi:glucokinase